MKRGRGLFEHVVWVSYRPVVPGLPAHARLITLAQYVWRAAKRVCTRVCACIRVCVCVHMYMSVSSRGAWPLWGIRSVSRLERRVGGGGGGRHSPVMAPGVGGNGLMVTGPDYLLSVPPAWAFGGQRFAPSGKKSPTGSSIRSAAAKSTRTERPMSKIAGSIPTGIHSTIIYYGTMVPDSRPTAQPGPLRVWKPAIRGSCLSRRQPSELSWCEIGLRVCEHKSIVHAKILCDEPSEWQVTYAWCTFAPGRMQAALSQSNFSNACWNHLCGHESEKLNNSK